MRCICELTAMQAEFKVESIKQADFKNKKTVYTIPLYDQEFDVHQFYDE